AEILVRGARVAVHAAVFTAAVRVHARVEADVGAVVGRDDRARGIGEELRRRAQGLEARGLLLRRRAPDRLEAVGRIAGGAARPHEAKVKRMSPGGATNPSSQTQRGGGGAPARG